MDQDLGLSKDGLAQLGEEVLTDNGLGIGWAVLDGWRPMLENGASGLNHNGGVVVGGDEAI